MFGATVDILAAFEIALLASFSLRNIDEQLLRNWTTRKPSRE